MTTLVARMLANVHTAAEWATDTHPVLLLNERGVESDTGREKLGDGVSLWNALPYWEPAAAAPTSAEFDQATPDTTWGPFTHGLGFRPNVTCVSSAGDEFIPDAVHYTPTTITVTMAAPQAGKVYAS